MKLLDPALADPSRTLPLRAGLARELRDLFARQAGVRLLNAFCPTGEGGGQDNTCAPGQGASERNHPETLARAKAGDRAAVAKIVADNQGMVKKLAKGFAGKDRQLFDDLVSEGNFGLLRAIEKFDPAKGFKFSTYAYHWANGKMRNAVAKLQAERRGTGALTVDPEAPKASEPSAEIPRSVHEALGKLEPRLAEVVKSLYGLGGADKQTGDQLAQRLGVTKGRISQMKAEGIKALRAAAGTANALVWVENLAEEVIAVDFDGTLAKQSGPGLPFNPSFTGQPVMRVVRAVRRLLAQGKRVEILTARAWSDGSQNGNAKRRLGVAAVERFCRRWLGRALPVTAVKRPDMAAFWDDRCAAPDGEPCEQSIIDVPDVRQHNHFACGAAATTAVTWYFRVGFVPQVPYVQDDAGEAWEDAVKAALDKTADALGTNIEESTSPQAIENYLRGLGLEVEARDGMTVDDLADNVRQGMPTICPVQDYGPAVPEKARWPYGHYVTVIGVLGGAPNRYVMCQDSSEDNIIAGEDSIQAPGRIVVHEADWMKGWHDVDKDGNPYVRFGIAVGPGATANAFCPGEGARDNSCSSAGGTGGSSSGSGGGSSVLTDSPAAKAAADPASHGIKGEGTRDNPYKVGGNIELAAHLLHAGHHVELDQPDQVATLIDRLSEKVLAAAALGEKAPDIDLCKVSVPGSNLFCQETMGVPRIKMPQLRGIPDPDGRASVLPKNKAGKVDVGEKFLKHLDDRGIKVKERTVRVSHLRASQEQIVGSRVAELVRRGKAEGVDELRKRPIYVTKDNYVLDGHHHWAALVALGAGKGKDYKIPVRVVDVDIGKGIALANAFAKYMGLKAKSGSTSNAELLANWCNQHGGDTCTGGERAGMDTGKLANPTGQAQERKAGLLGRIKAKVGALVDRVPVLGSVKRAAGAVMGKIHAGLTARYGERTASLIMSSGPLGGALNTAGYVSMAAGLGGLGVTGLNDVVALVGGAAIAEAAYRLRGGKAGKESRDRASLRSTFGLKNQARNGPPQEWLDKVATQVAKHAAAAMAGHARLAHAGLRDALGKDHEALKLAKALRDEVNDGRQEGVAGHAPARAGERAAVGNAAAAGTALTSAELDSIWGAPGTVWVDQRTGLPYLRNELTENPFTSEAQRRACWAADDPSWDCSAWEKVTPKDKLPERKKADNASLDADLFRREVNRCQTRWALLAWRQGLTRAWDEAVPARLRRAMPGLFAPALWGRARFPDGKVRRVVTQPAADPDTFMAGGRDEYLRANEPRLPAFLRRKLRQAGKGNLQAALNEGQALIAAAQATGQLTGYRALGVVETELLPCPLCRIDAVAARFAGPDAVEQLVPRKPGCLCAWIAVNNVLQPRTFNDFCRTGQGGGIDPTCGRESGGASKESKYTGQKVGWRERARTDEIEKTVAAALGFQHESDYKFYDAKSPDDQHFVEIKSSLKGEKQSVNAHADALLRKVEGMAEHPGATFHTVFKDERDTWEGGAHAENYSGHGIYYKRGNGRYAIGEMHPVKDMTELRRLMKMPDDKLPEKARGALPVGKAAVNRLRALAAKESEARKGRDARRRAKAKAEGRSVYERVT